MSDQDLTLIRAVIERHRYGSILTVGLAEQVEDALAALSRLSERATQQEAEIATTNDSMLNAVELLTRERLDRLRLVGELAAAQEALRAIASCESRVPGDVVAIARAALSTGETQPENVVSIEEKWCVECRAGRHVYCLDDGSGSASCSCNCGDGHTPAFGRAEQ